MTRQPAPESAERDTGEAGDDRTMAALSVLGFSISLGIGTLALPLLALAAGYDAAVVGAFAATSAVAQLGFRLSLPWLLGRYSDRSLLGISCLMIAGSYAVLVVSTALPAFTVGHLLQGSARALFWTSSQTHAVRGSGTSVNALARVQIVGNIGTLTGPALAGAASGISVNLALVVGIATGLLAALSSRSMRSLPPFVRERRRPGEAHIWRRPGVDVGCWASFTAGGWRAMLGSYFPVVLTEAGLGPGLVGAFLALADAASFGAAAILIRVNPTATRLLIEVGVLAASIGIAVMPFVAMQPAVAAILIAVGGAGSGLLLTLGPAAASDSVAPNERGDAIAVAGTFRAAALFATPAGVAAGLSVVTLPFGVAIAGVVLGVPTVVSGLRARRLG
jgi:hypothetical protein